MTAEWKPSVTSGFGRKSRWTKRGTETYTVRGYRGVARRFVGGKESFERCEHVHHKRSAAMECAERIAKSLNKSLDNQG